MKSFYIGKAVVEENPAGFQVEAEIIDLRGTRHTFHSDIYGKREDAERLADTLRQ